jgi:hypothetical protein
MKINVPKYVLLKPLSIALIGTMLSTTLLMSCTSHEPPVQKSQVERLAGSINAKCPFMLDEVTRMDSVNIFPDSTFQYNYTLVTQEKSNIDVEGLIRFIKPRILGSIVTSSNMKVQRDHHLTMVFHYRDRNGEFVTKITVEPEDYQ